MDIDALSGQPLDELMGKFMGWHETPLTAVSIFGGKRTETTDFLWADKKGKAVRDADWSPTSGRRLSNAGSDVWLKALADGWMVTILRENGQFTVIVDGERENGAPCGSKVTAPTLPLALCRAVAKAYTEGESVA